MSYKNATIILWRVLVNKNFESPFKFIRPSHDGGGEGIQVSASMRTDHPAGIAFDLGDARGLMECIVSLTISGKMGQIGVLLIQQSVSGQIA